MKYINSKIPMLTLLLASASACTDSYDCSFELEKPEEVAYDEYLSKYKVLKAYVNTESENFSFGVNMTPEKFAQKDVAYRTLLANFNAIDINGVFTPLTALQDDGSYNFNEMMSATNQIAQQGIDIYGGVLCSNQGQRTAYYNTLIEPVYLPVQVEKGTSIITDFEADELGTAYEMTNGSSATIVEDPEGKSGKCLLVGTAESMANNSWAKIHVKLPTGRKLGDYVRLNFSLRHVSNNGISGQGLKVMINKTKYSTSVSASAFKVSDQWNRECVVKMNDATAPGFILGPSHASLTEFDLCIGSQSGAAWYYLDDISMDYEVAGEGTTTVDFEKETNGTTFPMVTDKNEEAAATNTAIITTDDTHGKVLTIVAQNAFPTFHVKLKDGLTLANYDYLQMDMRMRTGQYGEGMQMMFNGTLVKAQTARSFGFRHDNTWRDGMFLVKFVREGDPAADGKTTLALPAELMSLTEFDFAITSKSGDFQADIDNISFHWQEEAETIEKTEEEKKTIFTNEMSKWIGGMVIAGVNETKNVKAWNIIGEPLSTTNDENTFIWGNYLGADDYARTAVKIVRDTLATVNAKAELYVANTFNQFDDMGSKVAQLISLVDSWEADGTTYIDGYNILLHTVYSQDLLNQDLNRQVITDLFTALAATGKKVRISDFNMTVEDPTGNLITSTTLAAEERQAAGEYMAYIIKEYRRLIPAESQAGFSLSSMAEVNGGYQVCPWTSAYNRNMMYEGIVNGLTK